MQDPADDPGGRPGGRPTRDRPDHGRGPAAFACACACASGGLGDDLASGGQAPPTWHLTRTLIAAGLHGALVPNLAPGARADARNLVSWVRADGPPCALRVIDDCGRLPRYTASGPAD